jgi:signal transduction histidine kinase
MGITETDIPHITEPFFRGKNAENVPGIGMGLFVARHCIELHEGIMNVQSELGKETTITITLPFVEAF